VGLRRKLPDARQRLDRDAGRGMHADVNRDQARVLQDIAVELFER
jgi:hypothetical protein